MTDVVGRLRLWAREAPQSVLLVTAGRSYTYSGLLARAEAMAVVLRGAGCARGARVAIYLEEYDQFFISMIGVWLAGGVVVPLNTSLPSADVERLVEKADPALLIVASPDVQASAVPRRLAVTHDAEGLVDGLLDAEQGDADHVSRALAMPLGADRGDPTSGDELAMVMFTSGTTGVPKGACQTARAVAANAGHVVRELELRADDRVFINTPPYFTSGICHFLTLLAVGGSVAGQLGFFFGAGLLDEMETLGCTGFGGAPAHLVRVVEPLDEPQRRRLRFWVSSGDHLPMPVIEKFTRMLPGVHLFYMYGLTEVSGRLCILPPADLETRSGSVGRPICDMSVVARRPDGAQTDPGESGELFVTGPLLMQGYLDEPDLTAAALTRFGFRTGDFGSVDADGYVWVEGRKDDIIKRGGEKVSIVHVQEALQGLDRFADVAVLPVRDEFLGHVPVAFVVPRDGDVIRASRVLRDLRAVLPPSALPSRLIVVRAIPRTGSGKAKRGELLAIFAEESG